MNNISENLFQDAAGKIDYTLMNDYMFRAVLQEHENVLKGLIASLLHLNSEAIKSTTVLNPIELGKDYSDKTFVLDIKVLLNDAAVVNLEMQVAGQDFLNFSPFPDYPEFYATNQMMNIKKHYIYNDNFTLNVLDLNQIHLATEEDKAYKIDY